MIHHAQAETAEGIANLLRSRGRIIITAPPRSGKTTELIRYAEERFPNGRFAVVCANEDVGKYIIRLHWNIYNGISFANFCAKRLLGEKIKGEDVNEPTILTPNHNLYSGNPSIPFFADEWNLLPQDTQRAIVKRRLFIAATTSPRENTTHASEEDQDR